MDWPPETLPEIGKQAYREAVATLRAELLELQHALREAEFPVIVLLGGVDGAGKHELANLLTEWLDPRFIRTLAYPRETSLPARGLLRFWADLPAHGEMAIVLSGWYSAPLLSRVHESIDAAEYAVQLRHIAAFEQDLVADGTLVLKYWLHLDAASQRQRLLALVNDADAYWQLQPSDWANLHLYEEFMAATRSLMAAPTPVPWHCVDGKPPRARALAVAQHLAAALRARLCLVRPEEGAPPAPARVPDRLGQSAQPAVGKASYKKRLRAGQAALHRYSLRLRQQARSLVLVFEGWDAAGKGGAIRRLLQALDARYVQVHRIAAPSSHELAHHYLWRFVSRLPKDGHIAIYDRSWYGRVLVERVEGFASPPRWQAAYDEINRFEALWTATGHKLLKFWLHISPEEQLARFEARQQDPLKNWKLTDEDWRNRERWPEYCDAVNEMLARTDRPQAPWQVIGANDKRAARLAVLEGLNEALA